MNEYVIIIGAMKSGTTTLFELLAQHPAIAPASNKEPGFFALDEIWDKGFDWYQSLFAFDPSVHKYRLEASTDYTKYPFVENVWGRMTSRDDVSVRLIYIMRHPFRRLESHARHVQGARKELGQRLSLRPDHSLDAGLSQISLAASQYAAQIETFRPALDQGRLHLLTFEELRADPDGCMAGILDFLGLDPTATLETLPVYNAAGSKRRAHPLWARATQVDGLMALGRNTMPSGLRSWIKGRLEPKITVEGRFKLTAEEEAQLQLLYREDLRQLRHEFGIDTAGLWGLEP
ncbi:MAG: sulfotransferase [Pseudomonadota bacterium]